MNPATLAIALLLAVVVWGLIVRNLTARPWEAAESPANLSLRDIAPLNQPPLRVVFFALLAVISSFFLLFMSAYIMRMDPGHGGGDWHSVGEPAILWFNTLLLMLASVAMQWSRKAAASPGGSHLVLALTLGGLLTLAFLGGQVIAWNQLETSMPISTNPASAFFILLTALHGLHLIGGLIVWGKSLLRIGRGATADAVQLGVQLCSIYWHYLLVVWLILFTLLLTT